MPLDNGTPGQPNSTLEPNIGPTYDGFAHAPVVPDPQESVTVSVQADDPDNVAAMALFWSIDGGPWNSEPMTPQPDGVYAGTIPGQNAGTVVFVELPAATRG